MNEANMRLKTKSGKHVVADVTDPSFYPGKVPPAPYQDPDHEGPWFFWPARYLDADFGGITTAKLQGFPMCYSEGFATAKEALEAAEDVEQIIFELVWDATIGEGGVPETLDPVCTRVKILLKRDLTPVERDLAKEAWNHCYRRFHQP